ncbi:hypothetical protein BdWA1_000395 [Babesia duncani]|uniref:Uncharacterized protein n=1 Tax=Babesia duncani TaxID=323732 RepID=A0AAD9UQ20_9APIC|nr:hypothetical protein BdWA1_000395 [Babesia duncani]
MTMFDLLPATKLAGFTYINVSNTKQLKAGMSKPNPRLVYCSNVRLNQKQIYVINTTNGHLPSWIDKIAIDCSAKLPSGKSGYERFGLDQETTVMFMQPYGKRAITITIDELMQPPRFLQHVTDTCGFKFKRVFGNEDVSKALDSKAPILAITTDGIKFNMYTQDPSQISNMVNEQKLHRIQGLLINDIVHELQLDPSFKYQKQNHVNIFCINRDVKGKYLAKHYAQEFPNKLEEFITECASGKGLVPIAKAPNVLKRAQAS